MLLRADIMDITYYYVAVENQQQQQASLYRLGEDVPIKKKGRRKWLQKEEDRKQCSETKGSRRS